MQSRFSKSLFLWLALAACHQDRPPRAISEVASLAPVRNDPAARGDFTQPLKLPDGTKPGHEGDRDFPAYASVHDDRFDLGPAAARDVPVTLAGASLVVAQAIAFGKAAAIDLAIRRDGVAAVSATPLALPDRAEATVAAALDGTGSITIHITNRAPEPVRVQLVVEIAQQGGP